MDILSVFREKVYEPLGKLLVEQGDTGFITQGPELVRGVYQENPELFADLETKHAEKGYTRKRVICDNGRHAARCMEWAPEGISGIHEHGGRPCFDIVLEGSIDIVDYYPEHVSGSMYRLAEIRRYTVGVGDFVIVNPFFDASEVHGAASPHGRSTSLHFYPIDHRSVGVYESQEGGMYERTEHDVPDD